MAKQVNGLQHHKAPRDQDSLEWLKYIVYWNPTSMEGFEAKVER